MNIFYSNENVTLSRTQGIFVLQGIYLILTSVCQHLISQLVASDGEYVSLFLVEILHQKDTVRSSCLGQRAEGNIRVNLVHGGLILAFLDGISVTCM